MPKAAAGPDGGSSRSVISRQLLPLGSRSHLLYASREMVNQTLLIVELLRVIETYIDDFDFRNIINSSKLFLELKRQVTFLRLNREYSIQFITSEKFRQIVLNEIHNPRVQLSLRLSEVNFHQLQFPNNSSPGSFLSNIHTLNMSGSLSLPALNLFRNILSLDLSCCSEITSVPAELASIPRLNLSHCHNLVHVHNLAGAKVLYLRRCPRLTDVSSLGNVEELYLSYNPQLVDIAGLGLQSRVLDLSFCSGIKNVEHLGAVDFLNLNYCTAVANVLAIRDRVRFLSAIDVPNL
jgi:hypothetical protein